MAVLKVIEILANSKESWEDAARQAVKEASKTVKNIRSIYIKDQSCVVDGEQITHFRVTVKVTFEVK
ncbi:dodecin domain-containing protein [Aequorivita sp. H23M31]|uniref:Dodecin domain-containing protein n=1 Tax=Aequorivita ciconiae TaxID=2494375 RepID=A0A410G3S2_9FLAO|nr:dodecin family protein [Aequorivita sp. H23M31]QAA81920.1 dodecin domain-containing protein [Aequorivita sp. H23M31]